MKRKPQEQWADLLRLSSVGLTLAICVGLGAWGGVWLDERWSTSPWLTVLGVALGTAAGFVQLVKELSKSTRKDE